MKQSFYPNNKDIHGRAFYHIFEYKYKDNFLTATFHFCYNPLPRFSLGVSYLYIWEGLINTEYQMLNLYLDNTYHLCFKKDYHFKTKYAEKRINKFLRNLDEIAPFLYIYGVGL